MSLYAIGLGNMTVKSALDQPFSAEIELIDVGSTPLPGIRVGLADPENFDEVGIERTAILSLLSFRIEKNAQGKYIILVQSQERMTEPYIELVVDLTWPQGQLYKAYTVLLDPPGYQLVSTTAQSSPTHYKTVQKHTYEPGVINKTVSTKVEHNPLNLNDSKKKSTYGPTITNENVWQIALRYKTSEIILPQVVLAIVGANPDAFIEGNLNGLKVGVRLVIPGTEEIMRVPADLATEEVMAHDKAWNEKMPVNHVLSPPYLNGKTLTSNPPMNNSQIPTIPKMIIQAEPTQGSASQLIPVNTALPVMNNNQQQSMPNNNSPQDSDRDAKTRAELSITTAAVESVRESNALLMEQLHLMQDQNKKLQQQLDKRDKELEQLQAQVQVMMKQRFAVAAQASSSNSNNSTTSYWPFFLLLLVAAGGGGFAYWYFILRKQESEESPYLTETPIEPKPFTPLVKPAPLIVEESTTEPQSNPEPVPADSQREQTQAEVVEHVNKEALDDVKKEPAAEQTVTEIEHEAKLENEVSPEKVIKKRPGRKKKETLNEPLIELASKDDSHKEEQNSVIEPYERVDQTTREPSVTPEQSNAVQLERSLIEVQPTENEQQSDESVHEIQNEAASDEELPEHDVLEFEAGLHEVLKEQSTKPSAEDKAYEDPDKDMALDFVSSLSEIPVSERDQKPVDEVKDDGEHLTDSFSPQESTHQIDNVETPVDASVTKIHDVDLDKSITDFFVEPSQEKINSDDRSLNDESSSTAETEINNESANPLKSTKALNTLLDLAKTYIGMDDFESARHSLEEVLEYGNEQQKAEAKGLLEQIKER